MKNYGVQITVTAPHDDAYCVYQLAQEPPAVEYVRTGPVAWIDKQKPDAEKRLMDVVRLGLGGKITTTKSL